MSNHTPQKRQIIVGVDGSPNSENAVDWAVAYAHAGDTITLVSAWSPIIVPAEMAMSYSFDDTGAHTILDSEHKRISKAAAGSDITVKTHFENNDPRNALMGLKSDLIVVGARGHGAVLGLLLGSVADYVSRHAKVPVVIVPAK
jgi:nucleotide-binding universal stress UspA family protein